MGNRVHGSRHARADRSARASAHAMRQIRARSGSGEFKRMLAYGGPVRSQPMWLKILLGCLLVLAVLAIALDSWLSTLPHDYF